MVVIVSRPGAAQPATELAGLLASARAQAAAACARLLARLESMPVLEQAKGIIMTQSHCGNAQAFDLLRRASQRANVPVRDLAAQIVAKTAQVPPKRARQALRSGEVA